MQDALIVIVARRDKKLTYGVAVMIHLQMTIQLFEPHFAMMQVDAKPGDPQWCS